ncbi:transposable element Tcb1 transposase [Trichonephila clavipes]|nr:transposable element Tcb1 transposase [Trichonephila clavipes]
MQEKNNSTRENNSTQQQERTTQLGSRNETTQLVSRNETTQLNRRKQLNSSVGTKQLNSALPSTAYNAYNRLQPPTTACNRLQPPATACNRLQPPATAYNRLQPPAPPAPPLQQNRLFLPTVDLREQKTRKDSGRLQQSGLSARRPLLGLPLTQSHRRLRRQWYDERRMWVAEWNEVVFTDESRICLQHHDGWIRVWRHREERMLNS